MNSKKNGGKGSFAAATGSSSKGKGSISQQGMSARGFVQMNPPMENFNTISAEDGGWEVFGKKSQNRNGTGAKQHDKDYPQKQPAAGYGRTGSSPGQNWPAQTLNSKRPDGRGNPKSQPSNKVWEAAYMAPPPKIPPALDQGWNWAARAGSSASQPKTSEASKYEDSIASEPSINGSSLGRDSWYARCQHPDDGSDHGIGVDGANDEDAVDELLVESDDDLLSDDDDSDASQKSHETQKKNRWFVKFFEELDKLTNDQINEPSRQWHCPACQGGPGAIDWYRGLQPLMTHAKTKGSKRAIMHRRFARVLEEELQLRGTSVNPIGESFGHWKGLSESVPDHAIVWPPMVVIMNTKLEKEKNEKWKGMGNQELLDYFSSYDAVKARHSYGPQGHRGMSVLIFEGSPTGYFEAERLDKHFVDEGTDRGAWDRFPKHFYPGGQRQLYGYMARKEDMDQFNQHSQGKSKLKYDMRSYHEVVVIPMKQMSEDNQLLQWYKNKVAKQQEHEKALEQTMGVMSNKLRLTNEENRMVKQRTTIQHEENKEQMDNLEFFLKYQVSGIHEMLEAQVTALKKLLDEEHEKAKNSEVESESKLRPEEVARLKGIEEFVTEKEKLVRELEEKKTQLMRKFISDTLDMDKALATRLNQLMSKYIPHPSISSSSS